MDRRILLVRHAKSSWGDASLRDFDRPLNDRGLRDLPRMAERLARRAITVDRLLSSPAARAHATAEGLAAAVGIETIDFEARIYDASHDELLQILREQSDAVGRLMMVGHNPGMTDLANHLADAGIDNLPTCAIVELSVSIDSWRQLDAGKAQLVAIDAPKSSGSSD